MPLPPQVLHVTQFKPSRVSSKDCYVHTYKVTSFKHKNKTIKGDVGVLYIEMLYIETVTLQTLS